MGSKRSHRRPPLPPNPPFSRKSNLGGFEDLRGAHWIARLSGWWQLPLAPSCRCSTHSLEPMKKMPEKKATTPIYRDLRKRPLPHIEPVLWECKTVTDRWQVESHSVPSSWDQKNLSVPSWILFYRLRSSDSKTSLQMFRWGPELGLQSSWQGRYICLKGVLGHKKCHTFTKHLEEHIHHMQKLKYSVEIRVSIFGIWGNLCIFLASFVCFCSQKASEKIVNIIGMNMGQL